MTSSPPLARPLYLAAIPDAVFGMFHPAADGRGSKTAVLICPPWGWDEVASYRSRRAWAEHLAERGHPTLRIDFPGSGDSAGSAGDPGRVEAWTAAVIAATTWLADSTPSGRVAVVGLGLGGLIAGHALNEGAPIHDLVLWAAPTQGRSILREQRAFGKLQSDRYGSIEGTDQTLPEGWLEIGGFVETAETIAAIQKLDLRTIAPGTLQRALLLGRDGLPVDVALQHRLRDAGVEVTVAPGNGWGDMCFHPERYQPPLEVFERIEEWLAKVPPRSAGSSGGEPAPGGASGAEPGAIIPVDGLRVRETALANGKLPHGFFGILAEPEGPPEAPEPVRTDTCVVFLNAGAVRRMGPNRMWVEAARRWAANGVPTVRVDVEGIGDATGDAAQYVDLANFYKPERPPHVSAIIDALEARGLGPRFVLIGLCAGAYAGFNTAAIDRRVIAALAINPRLLVWDPAILVRRNASVATQVLELGSWQRILSGETTPARMLEIGRAAAAEAPRAARRYASRLRGERRREPWADRLDGVLGTLREADTRVVLAFSGDEPMYNDLKAARVLDRLGQWPNVVLTDLPGDDHTLRPIAAQRAFHQLIDRELDGLVNGPSVAGPAGSTLERSRREAGGQPG